MKQNERLSNPRQKKNKYCRHTQLVGWMGKLAMTVGVDLKTHLRTYEKFKRYMRFGKKKTNEIKER